MHTSRQSGSQDIKGRHEPPAHLSSGKLPYLTQWHQHRWVISTALVPLVFHQAWMSWKQQKLDATWATLLYLFFYILFLSRDCLMLHSVGLQYGFLDQDNSPRDKTRKFGLDRVYLSMIKAAVSRTIMMVCLTHNPATPPLAHLSDVTWWLNLSYKASLYGVLLDFWFYWYHRAMHEVMPLWHFHKRHHLTKHPLAYLRGYADNTQEFFDMLVIPTLTYFTLRSIGHPLDFFQWWIAMRYIDYTEALAHSGIRANASAPSTFFWLLQLLEVDFGIEDHDLHHREGWRHSFNYGKQTRLWDYVFGTSRARVESVRGNTDFSYQVRIPIC